MEKPVITLELLLTVLFLQYSELLVWGEQPD